MNRVAFISLVLPMSFTMVYLFGKQPNKTSKQYRKVVKKSTSDIRKVVEDPGNADVDSVMNLLDAMIQVESRGNVDAVGDEHLGSPSVGVLQIRPIMVKEVNRILKKCNESKTYELDDRYSRDKSIAMFQIWKAYYHNHSTLEKIARCWNGGPRGYKMNATIHYWNKVKAYL